MIFDNWSSILRILIVGFSAYFVLIFLLRLSGKRTLSKWNAFDFVVTVALGSVLATVVVSKDVTLMDGVWALILLIVLQFIITRLSIKIKWVENLIKAKPTLLFSKGEFLSAALEKQRVTESEIRMAIRAAGCAAVEEIEAVVLETDGTLSVIQKSSTGSRTALEDVAGET